MCGNFFSHPGKTIAKEIANPLHTLENIGETALPIVGGIVGGPLGAAAGGAAEGALRGGGLTGALEGGALAGVGSLATGALTDAATNYFPETSAAISNAIPDLGIGSTVNSVANSLGLGGSADPTAAGANVQPGTTTSGAPSNVTAAPASGGVGAGAAGSAAPASIGGASSTDLTSLSSIDPNGFSNVASQLNNSGDLGTVGSPATSTANTGTPSISNSASIGGASQGGLTSLGGIDPNSFANSGGTGPGAASSPSSISNFTSNFDKSNLGFNSTNAGNAWDVVKANPGPIISAAGLGVSALEQGKSLEGERQLKQQAGAEAAQGQQLESYLSSGTLPPGIQQGITQAADSAKATIRSQYAAKGMSGSSAEQQDLAAVDERAQAQGSQMALQLLQTGISESGMSSSLYQALLSNATTQDTNLGSAIANFASAAGGGGQIGKGGEFILKQA